MYYSTRSCTIIDYNRYNNIHFCTIIMNSPPSPAPSPRVLAHRWVTWRGLPYHGPCRPLRLEGLGLATCTGIPGSPQTYHSCGRGPSCGGPQLSSTPSSPMTWDQGRTRLRFFKRFRQSMRRPCWLLASTMPALMRGPRVASPPGFGRRRLAAQTSWFGSRIWRVPFPFSDNLTASQRRQPRQLRRPGRGPSPGLGPILCGSLWP